MGYRIVYGSENDRKSKNQRNWARVKTLTALGLLLFVFAAKQIWPEGTQLLQCAFLPGEPNAGQVAASNFMIQIRQGIGFEEALRTYCLEILEDADPA